MKHVSKEIGIKHIKTNLSVPCPAFSPVYTAPRIAHLCVAMGAGVPGTGTLCNPKLTPSDETGAQNIQEINTVKSPQKNILVINIEWDQYCPCLSVSLMLKHAVDCSGL